VRGLDAAQGIGEDIPGFVDELLHDSSPGTASLRVQWRIFTPRADLSRLARGDRVSGARGGEPA
jgi:hypothetical protein